MTVKIGTLNSMGGDSKTLNIVDIFLNYNLDVLSVQETHEIKRINVQTIEEKTKAKVYVNHGTARGRGTIIIAKESSVIKNVTLHSNDGNGNMITISAQIGNENFKILNIYAENDYAKRIDQLKKINQIVENETNYINCGDFNCIEDYQLDCIHKNHRNFRYRKRDREILIDMRETHGYVDTFRELHPTLKQFTFTHSSIPYRARLDRIYVHRSMMNRITSTSIHPATFSDHDLYMIHIKSDAESERIRWGKGLWKHNASLLEKRENLQYIENAWMEWRDQKYLMENQMDWWEHGKRFIKDEEMKLGRITKSRMSEEERQLREELNSEMKKTEQSTPGKIREIKDKLNEIDQKKLNGAATRSRVDWAEKGEKCTSYFFNLEKKNSHNKQISELLSEDGIPLSTKDGILNYVHEHFKKKFERTEINHEACNILINSITRKLNDKEQKSMNGLFTMEELEKAHKRMSKNRSPGNDGLTYEFYKATWHFIKTDLLDTLNEILIQSTMPISMTQGIITLIYKNKGPRNNIKNWRAITLLNVDFKYLTSMIAARIAPSLGKLLNIDQGSGVEHRLIEDQIIIAQDIYDFYKSSNKSAMIQTHDLMSAFDLVSHEYMFKVLQAMNFSENTISLLKLIYTNMYSAVTINGAKTRYFQLSRSVRQGAPEAVSVFLLTIEPLANIIRTNNRLHPILIPNQPPKYVGMYVDDTTIYSEKASDHQIIQELTTLFENGSGAHFNPTKTEILLLGKWTDEERRKLPEENIKKNIKLLGVWIGPDAEQLNSETVLKKIDAAIEFWTNIKLSFQGKKLIINTKIMPQIYHVARITGINKQLQREIRKRITNFFWHPRKMCLVAMATLQNTVEDGGLGLPNLGNINKAILTERICKMMKREKPWMGQVIFRNGYSLRSLNPSFGSPNYAHTFVQTPVSNIIIATFRELQQKITDWSKENFKSLQKKLYTKSDYPKRANRDFKDTWTEISRSTNDRKARDICYLTAHDSLTLNAMLHRRGVIRSNICELCRKSPETIQHVFINCEKIKRAKHLLESLIDTDPHNTLSEEEILYHEGRIKSKKKDNRLVATYKHSIWICRALLYYGEVTEFEITDSILAVFKKMNENR